MSYDPHTTVSSRPTIKRSSSPPSRSIDGSVEFASVGNGGSASSPPAGNGNGNGIGIGIGIGIGSGSGSGSGGDIPSGGVSAITSPPSAALPSVPPTIHKRTYQACIPCRQRKVRCDLGSVEAPHEPPCVRCRRESKACYFSATRRKTRNSSGSGDEVVLGVGRGRGSIRRGVVRKREEDSDSDGPGPLKKTRPKARSIGHASPLEVPQRPDSAAYPPPDYARSNNPSPTFSPYSQQQQSYQAQIDPRLRVQTTTTHPKPRHIDEERETTIATDTLLQTPVYNSHEALLTLIEAAGKDTPLSTGTKSTCLGSDTDGEGDDATCKGGSGDGRRPSAATLHEVHHSPAIHTATRTNGVNVRFSSVTSPPDQVAGSSLSSSNTRRRTGSTSTVSPGMRAYPVRSLSISTIQDPTEREAMEKSIRAWNKFRFVKAGWFTAREAIGYVDYFYRHLHPLSPTLTNPSLQHITHPIHHPLLLKHEPFLTTIILLITSRYQILSAPGGLSRSYAIHDMLWREVRGGCEGLMWGGGWGSPGTPHMGSGGGGLGSANGASKVARGLRTLGTVEGLLLLTEWHVRGLHFPMDVEEGDWMVDVSDDEEHPHPNRPRKARAVVEGLGDRIENILEPAYRSDRMSWMLLGNALALAYELGVFDEIDEAAAVPATDAPAAEAAFRLRFARIQKLLLVYVLQLASRLGWTSMIPRHITHAVRHKLNSQAPSPASVSSGPTPVSSHPNTRWESEDELQDVIFHSWVDLTMLMKSSAELLFPSRSVTKSIMRSGKYVALLEHFRPLLREWKREFESLRLPEPITLILTMEYEHVRFYVNSLALQAVVDRCTTFNATAKSAGGGPGKSFAALMQLSPQDVEFIKEVVDASRALLSCVVEKMWPGGYLRHAPVRIYLRVLGASMFLLKTFALGAPEEEVLTSISLIDKTVDALRSASVDDVHLGLRFADLLETLTRRVKLRFVRMSRGSRTGTPLPSDDATAAAAATAVVDPRFDRTMPPPPPPQPTQPLTLTPGRLLYENYASSSPEAPVTPYGGEVPGDDPNFFFTGYEDWLALPIDPIVGAGFGGVTSGQMGPDVGGVDLLELLLGGGVGV